MVIIGTGSDGAAATAVTAAIIRVFILIVRRYEPETLLQRAKYTQADNYDET